MSTMPMTREEVLEAVYDGHTTTAAVSEWLGCSRHSAYMHLRTLELHGLLTVDGVRGPNRRTHTYSLTCRGRKAVAKLIALRGPRRAAHGSAPSCAP